MMVRAPIRVRRSGALLGAAALLLSARTANGQDQTLARVVSRLESYYRHSPGITAGFVQVLESRTLPTPQEESGTVSLKPPGRMRWEYLKPRGKLAVTDGKRTYLYLPEDRQVLIGDVRGLDEGAIAARLLLGTTPIASDFHVEGEPAPDAGGLWLLKLSPVQENFPYDSLTLEVEEETGAIRRIRLLDPLGNRIEYRFSNLRVVRDLPEKLFTYRIPRGVDVQMLGGEGTGPSPPP